MEAIPKRIPYLMWLESLQNDYGFTYCNCCNNTGIVTEIDDDHYDIDGECMSCDINKNTDLDTIHELVGHGVSKGDYTVISAYELQAWDKLYKRSLK